MKENFIKMLREATDNRTIYTPTPSIINTPHQSTTPNETNSQYENKGSMYTNPHISREHINEPIQNTAPTPEPINTKQPNINVPTNNQPAQNIPLKKINQIIETSPTSSTDCEQILEIWKALFPTIPSGAGQLSNYTPSSCSGKVYNFNFINNLSQREIARLIREIYLRILQALDTYSLLIRKESADNQRTLALLRTQMQVLSGAMLNVYQDYTVSNVVPLRVSINSHIPNNLQNAYCYLHDEIYYIYYLLSKLIFSLKNDANFYGQLVTILNNLKYQLSIINTIYSNLNS